MTVGLARFEEVGILGRCGGPNIDAAFARRDGSA